MFNDKVTLYRKVGDTYTMTIIDKCYWYGKEGEQTNGHGVQRASGYNVFTKNLNADVKCGDVCLLGLGVPISSKAELPTAEVFIVSGVNRNVKGTRIDHIEFYGN